MVGNEFGGATFYTADGAAVPGTDLIPAAVDNGLSGERVRPTVWLRWRCGWRPGARWGPATMPQACSPATPSPARLPRRPVRRAPSPPPAAHLPSPSLPSVLANTMVALGLMVGTRLIAFLTLLLMHRLKRI